MKTTMERFEAKFIPEPNSGCWLWTASSFNKQGYGSFWDGERIRSAHRFSYTTFVGPIPNGHEVMHRCDIPSCVNPDHLTTGTPKDNTQDRVRKGRSARRYGESNPNAKLTAADHEEIRRRYAAGDSNPAIARTFGIDRAYVWTLTRSLNRATAGA